MTTQILRRLGGGYSLFAEQIESALTPDSQNNQPLETKNIVTYSVGGSVQAGGGVYLPRKSDDELLKLCREGQFAYVLTSRQMGKSSLMIHTAERLEHEDVTSIIIDLTKIGTRVTMEQWYLGLLTEIDGNLMLDTDIFDWWKEHNHLSPLYRLTRFFEVVLLTEVEGRIVIFVDEIDITLSLDFSDDFFAVIRACYNQRAENSGFNRFSFVFLGVATPEMLINNPRKTPFNICQQVELTDFSFEEALPLARGLTSNTDDAETILRWILDWTSGHPYLTLKLCVAIHEQKKQQWSETDVDEIVKRVCLDAFENDNNLIFVRDFLLRRVPDVSEVLTLYREILQNRQQVSDAQVNISVKSYLKLSGIIKTERAGKHLVLKVRNRIYRTLFNENWIDKNLPTSQKNPLSRFGSRIYKTLFGEDESDATSTVSTASLSTVSAADLESQDSPTQKILFLSAEPKEAGRLRLSEEVREIEEALRLSKNRANLILEEHWAVRPRDWTRALLEEKPYIVHFSGYGADVDGLAVENDNGQTQFLDNKALANFFRFFPTMQCVVLNACYTEVQAAAISEFVPYVIGIPKALNDKAAREFAVGFYDALGAGKNLESAYQFGCNAISLYGIDESYSPVLLQKVEGQTQSPSPTLTAQNQNSTSVQSVRIFISYKRDVEPDKSLALEIYRTLNENYEIVIDQEIPLRNRWLEQIENQLRQSDILIILLSEISVNSEMVAGELEVVHRLAQEKEVIPMILPVRLSYRAPFPYPLSEYLNRINCAFWQNESDTPRLIAELQQTIQGNSFSSNSDSLKAEVLSTSEPSPAFLSPRPATEPQSLETPEGTVDSESVFYIERHPDQVALDSIQRQGVTIIIKGPSQMGKSSLLNRMMARAVEEGKQVAFLDFQLFDEAALQDTEVFYQQFCFWLTDELDLDNQIEEYWQSRLSAPQRCTHYVGRYILPTLDQPLVLAMDEVDRIFEMPLRNDFFSMLRSWHNQRARSKIWQQLDLVLVTSTEPYQLITDLNQSPFNVGEVLELDDFSLEQLHDLNQRYGLPLSKRQENQLMQLVNGHPYLVHRALYLIANRQISVSQLFSQAIRDRGPFGDHLRYHLFRIYDKPELVSALLQVIRSKRCPDEQLFFRLRGAGLIRREGRKVLPRCQLYADYFRERLDS